MNPQSEIQIILRQRFSEIKSRNPRFSVRAFARQLGLQASATNEIMKGQRNISQAFAEKILDRLNLNTEERISICRNQNFFSQIFSLNEEALPRVLEILKSARVEIEKITMDEGSRNIEVTVIISENGHSPIIGLENSKNHGD